MTFSPVVLLIFLSVQTFTLANNANLQEMWFGGGQYEFIDLTYPFDNSTVYWPGVQRFEYATFEFTAGEHGGTHFDAPYHFSSTGLRVGEIPLNKLIVPLIIVDVSSIANNDPSFVLKKNHLDHNILNDNLGKPCLLIFKFGWSKFYNTNTYLGLDEKQNTLNFPGISDEIAKWITTSFKNVVGVGVDVASVDPGSSKDYDAHKILAKAGLYNIENVNLSDQVRDHGCTALVMPMKITEGTGAPLRLVAVCPAKDPTFNVAENH